jgi:hypothetical protein
MQGEGTMRIKTYFLVCLVFMSMMPLAADAKPKRRFNLSGDVGRLTTAVTGVYSPGWTVYKDRPDGSYVTTVKEEPGYGWKLDLALVPASWLAFLAGAEQIWYAEMNVHTQSGGGQTSNSTLENKGSVYVSAKFNSPFGPDQEDDAGLVAPMWLPTWQVGYRRTDWVDAVFLELESLAPFGVAVHGRVEPAFHIGYTNEYWYYNEQYLMHQQANDLVLNFGAALYLGMLLESTGPSNHRCLSGLPTFRYDFTWFRPQASNPHEMVMNRFSLDQAISRHFTVMGAVEYYHDLKNLPGDSWDFWKIKVGIEF